MALALNTSHPLYASLQFLAAVDSDNLIRDLVTPSRVFTKAAGASYVIGAWGRALRTLATTNNPQGASFTPEMYYSTAAAGAVRTEFFAISGFSGGASNGTIAPEPFSSYAKANTTATAAVHPTTDLLGLLPSGGLNPSTLVYPATSINMNDGSPHSLCVVAVNVGSTENATLYYDGVAVATVTGATVGNVYRDYIGGGSYRSFGADFVWVASFNAALTAQQVSDLHASLGANNAFDLVQAPGTDASVAGGDAAVSVTADNAGASAEQNASAAGGDATITVTADDSGATGGNAGDVSVAGGDAAVSVSADNAGASVVANASVSGGDATVSVSADSAGASATAIPGAFTTEVMVNNAGMVQAGVSVSWTWWAGAIGSAPTSLTHGFGVTQADGTLLASSLPAGAGFLIVAAQDGSGIYYQPGTVA